MTIQGSTIIPSLRYRDARGMIDWLCKAFGFEKNAIHEENGIIVHAQLVYRGGMIMLGEVRDNDFGRYMAQPDEVAGRETQCAYVIVEDVKSHYEQARSAGAIVIDEYAEKEYGGAGYGCSDPEGHVWWFGSYDPWRSQ
jgi:uncharacterized glyoxalase superfamily protein PhnB